MCVNATCVVVYFVLGEKQIQTNTGEKWAALAQTLDRFTERARESKLSSTIPSNTHTLNIYFHLLLSLMCVCAQVMAWSVMHSSIGVYVCKSWLAA
jgi:hypothetical protein